MKLSIPFATCLLLIFAVPGSMAQDAPPYDSNAKVQDSVKKEAPSPKDSILADVMPVMIKEARPHYPKLARKEGWEGTVWVEVLVNRKGIPDTAYVFKTSGYRVLDDEAVKAGKKCRFKPAEKDHKPVAIWVAFPIEFTLKDK